MHFPKWNKKYNALSMPHIYVFHKRLTIIAQIVNLGKPRIMFQNSFGHKTIECNNDSFSKIP